MRPCRGRSDSTARSTSQEATANQERLGHLFDGFAFLPNCNSQRAQTNGTAPESATEHVKHRAVESIKPNRVHFIEVQGAVGDVAGDDPIGTHLGEVANSAQQTVGDSGCAS